MQRRGLEQVGIDDALQRATELGYLDDERFAFERARSLARQGKAAGVRIAQELQRLGVTADLAQRAIEAATEEFPPEQILRDLLGRRYHDFDYHHADERERGRVIRFFQRRGFPLSLVLSILKEER